MESGLPKTGTSTWVPRLIPRVPESPPKAAPRRRLKHHSETPSEVLSVVALPIWLGSPIQEDDVLLKDIKSIVPEDLHQHDDVIAIEEAESDSSFCATHRRFVDAAEHLEQAICVRQQLLGDEHEELLASIQKYVVSCNTWGVHCLSTGNFTAALELFKKAEAMTEADNVPNFKRRVALRAATFNNLCCYYRTRGKLNAALQFAEKALRIEQRYKEADSPASSYLNYAVLLSNSGRHHEALEHVERAVAVLHDHQRHEEAEGATEKPEPRETSQLLVVAHYNMFVENLHLKHFASSLQCLQRSVAVATNKLGSSHALTARMKEVQAEAQVRLDRKASAERFRTTAAVVESSPVFFHFQDGHCHPWQKVQLAKADATRAQEILADQKQITLRRLRPVDPRPPEKPRVRSRRPKQQMYARLPAIGAKVTGRWWETHPKLLETEGYAGSPILAQQAHGAQPMVEARALRQAASPRGDTGLNLETEGTQAALTDARTDATIAQPLPLAPAQIVPPPPGAPPEVVASWEYHHRRLQLLDGHGQTALEPQRMQAITILRDRLDKRRQKGLPTPTDCRRHQAATCIQAGIRGYLVRQWTSEELAREMRRQRLLEASSGVCSPTSDAKKRMAFRVIYAARRAFVENNAAVKIQKVARGSMTRAKLKRQISEIAHSSAAKVQALARGRAVRSSLRRQTEAATQIQARARVMLAKRKTDTVRQMARLINKLGRGFLARLRLRKQKARNHGEPPQGHLEETEVHPEAEAGPKEAEQEAEAEKDAVSPGILEGSLSPKGSLSPRPVVVEVSLDASEVEVESEAVSPGGLEGSLSSRPVVVVLDGGSTVSEACSKEAECEEESNAVLAGILDAGLSSRWSSPMPMDYDREGGSDVSHVSEETSGKVVVSIVGSQLEEFVQACEGVEGDSGIEDPSHAERRAFVENNAAVKIQKVARGSMTRAKLKRQISEIAHSSAAKVQALARGRAVRSSLRRQTEAATQIQARARVMLAKRKTDTVRQMARSVEAERQVQEESDAVLAGILDAGLSSRWSSPIPMDYDRGSDASHVSEEAERQVQEESDAVLAGILDAGLSSRMGSPMPMDYDRGGGSDVSHVSEEAERQVQEESDAVLAGILNAGLSSRWSSPMPMDYDREGGSDVSLFSEVQTERQAENDTVCAGLLEASFSPRWVSRSDVSEACSEAEQQAEGDAVLAGILDAGLSSRNSPMPMDYEGGSDISEACSEAERQAEGDAVLAGILDAGLSSRNSPMPMDYEGGSDISEARSAAERGVEADFFVQIIPDTTNSTLTIEDSGSIMTDVPLLDPYPKAVEVTPPKQRVHPGSCLASAPLQADAVSDVSPGVLRAGSTSPVDMDVDGRSDVSEETSGKVVASIVGSQLEEFAQACEGTSIVGLGGLEPPDSGIDDDVAGPSIEDLGKASSIADIHEEVENMVPAD